MADELEKAALNDRFSPIIASAGTDRVTVGTGTAAGAAWLGNGVRSIPATNTHTIIAAGSAGGWAENLTTLRCWLEKMDIFPSSGLTPNRHKPSKGFISPNESTRIHENCVNPEISPVTYICQTTVRLHHL